jgi:DNA-binding transcriptional LysR family regulator
MDLHRLRCFVTVVEEGNISKAAILLNMTQPPLSMLIRNLEKELNVTLFERRGKRLILTDTGRLLYIRAKELLASSEAIVREVTEQNQGMRGTVNVGSVTIANLTIIPKVIQKLKEQSLNIVVRVREGNSSYILHELRNQKVDIGILLSVFQVEDLHTTTLLTEPLLLALPPGHHLLEKSSIELIDLKDENFLLQATTFGQGISDLIIEACQTSGFSPNVIYWGTETLPMLFMVKKGLGIAFAPQSFRELRSPDLPQLVEISSPSLFTKLSLITVKNRFMTSVTKRFLDVTKDIIETMQSNK